MCHLADVGFFCFVFYMSICCVSCLGWFSLSQVSEHYESTNLLTALPSSFLEPLLSFTLMEEPEIRLLVLSILTSLIDRHHNVARLTNVRSGDQCVLLSVVGFSKVAARHLAAIYGHCNKDLNCICLSTARRLMSLCWS